jgi:hypothetical protein
MGHECFDDLFEPGSHPAPVLEPSENGFDDILLTV